MVNCISQWQIWQQISNIAFARKAFWAPSLFNKHLTNTCNRSNKKSNKRFSQILPNSAIDSQGKHEDEDLRTVWIGKLELTPTMGIRTAHDYIRNSQFTQKLCWQQGIITASLKKLLHSEHFNSNGKLVLCPGRVLHTGILLETRKMMSELQN